MTTKSATRVYLPDVIGQGYGDFWRCQKRYRVLKGGKGSKKSTTTALNHIVRLMQYPDANLLVVRKVGDTHRSSTFAQLRWAIRRLGVDAYWRATTSPMELTYTPTGQKILFRGMDDPLKLASTTVDHGVLCWVWIEEAYEIDNEADFDKLDLSVPRGNVPPPLFKQTTLTFNPWSETHWLKRRFSMRPLLMCQHTPLPIFATSGWMIRTKRYLPGCSAIIPVSSAWLVSAIGVWPTGLYMTDGRYGSLI